MSLQKSVTNLVSKFLQHSHQSQIYDKMVKEYIFTIVTVFLVLLIQFGLAMFVGGCRREGFVPVPDAGSDTNIWGSLPDVPVDPHTCDPDNVETDLFNCGWCGNVCDVAVSDRCQFGFCTCGNEGHFCNSETQECRFGSCRDSNPEGTVCEFDNNCPAGFGCVVGRCSFISCVPEVCDGVDNDCDGAIDGTGTAPLSRWCYDDDIPFEHMLNPPCSRGVQVCDTGVWQECEGDVSPVAETGLFACNGMDEDCDGCTDGTWNDDRTFCEPSVSFMYDVVYAIDTSGSMTPVIEAARLATMAFSDIYSSNPDFRFGLVVFPPLVYRPMTNYEMLTPLVRYEDFVAELGRLRVGSGSAEASWDVVSAVSSGDLSSLIGWRREANRVIILFTNESGQSYSIPPNTELSMCMSLGHGEVLAVLNYEMFLGDFNECSETFILSSEPAEMVEYLSSIITNPCE